MTLVTRSAVRLSRRGNQAINSARANAAFFTTAATQASNLLPKARAESSRMKMPSASGESLPHDTAIYGEEYGRQECSFELEIGKDGKERGSLEIKEKVRSDK